MTVLDVAILFSLAAVVGTIVGALVAIVGGSLLLSVGVGVGWAVAMLMALSMFDGKPR